VGGFSRVFEIGRVFRNEGIDATHNPEFTSIEFYAAYWDYNDVMRFTEGLYEFIAKELFGTTKIGIRKDRAGNEHEIDVKTPWTRLTMVGSIKKYGNIDVEKKSDEELRKILLDKGAHEPKKIHEAPRGILIAMLFEEFVEHHLVQPHFIIDHPIETTPLCKLHRNRELAEKGFVERFEAFILGFEASNAYTELNDPVLQRELLERQDRLLQEGDEEANPIDEEFLESIYQGMPPCGGCGIGIDRLIMLFTGQSSIRDVIFFPLMKEAGVVASTESIS
jgi:lysyl-tRNA synthetase class 2